MIAPTNRGGSSGGANREVVFKLRIDGTEATRGADAFGRKIDEIARKAGNIRLGGDVAGPSIGPTVAGVAPRVRQAARSPRDDGARQNRLRAQQLAAMDRETEFYRKRNEQAQRQADRERNAQARRDFLAIDRENKTFESRRTSTKTTGGGPTLLTGGVQGITRGQWGEALEGVTSLARAFVLLGVSSEENMAKAVRALAKFEAAAQGIRGILKVSEPLGSLLIKGGGMLGLGAGAGASSVGAAGLAAGVGAIGGGLAIADQLRYSRNGQIGRFSQGHADFFTRVARAREDYGIDPMNFAPGTDAIFRLTGYKRAVSDRARGDIGYESGLLNRGQMLGWQAEDGAAQLAAARGDLSATELLYRRQGMRRGYAMDFQSLAPGAQRRLLRRRDDYLNNPSAMKSRKAMSIYGLLGPAEQENFQIEMERRSGGLFDRGFGDLGGRKSVPPIKLDEVLMKRELVAKFEIQNTEVVNKLELALKEAARIGNEDLEAKFQAMVDKVQGEIDRVNASYQNSQNTIGNLRGY